VKTSPASAPITPEAARILVRWAGLAPAADLTAVFRAFRDRVERLYAIDVETVEFDFLRPMD
jgi:hypothetical protein